MLGMCITLKFPLKTASRPHCERCLAAVTQMGFNRRVFCLPEPFSAAVRFLQAGIRLDELLRRQLKTQKCVRQDQHAFPVSLRRFRASNKGTKWSCCFSRPVRWVLYKFKVVFGSVNKSVSAVKRRPRHSLMFEASSLLNMGLTSSPANI